VKLARNGELFIQSILSKEKTVSMWW
jgi:hypothetical protein